LSELYTFYANVTCAREQHILQFRVWSLFLCYN